VFVRQFFQKTREALYDLKISFGGKVSSYEFKLLNNYKNNKLINEVSTMHKKISSAYRGSKRLHRVRQYQRVFDAYQICKQI
jgi:hypothetical protein